MLPKRIDALHIATLIGTIFVGMVWRHRYNKLVAEVLSCEPRINELLELERSVKK